MLYENRSTISAQKYIPAAKRIRKKAREHSMELSVIATLVLVVLLGSVAYIAVAGTLVIYALGNNKAAKRKRTLFGLLGAFMLYLAIYTVIWLVKHGGIIF